jgi:hypothetical protein
MYDRTLWDVPWHWGFARYCVLSCEKETCSFLDQLQAFLGFYFAWVPRLVCRIVGHSIACTYCDEENGSETLECDRCGWSIEVWMTG